jgi:hypothetical protein
LLILVIFPVSLLKMLIKELLFRDVLEKMLLNFRNYFVTQLIVGSSYYLVKKLTVGHPVELDLTTIDTFFKPNFLAVWIYMSFFFMLIAGVTFSTKDKSIECCKIILTNSVIASIFFIFFPTKITYHDYAPYIDSNTASYVMMMMIKKYDDTYNCFPSLHIANSIIACYFLIQDKKIYIKVLSVLWLFLIFWSVISTKQHIFYDILGGGGVAFISFKINSWFKKLAGKIPNTSEAV